MAMAMSGVTQERLQRLSAWIMLKKRANLTCHVGLSKAKSNKESGKIMFFNKDKNELHVAPLSDMCML